MPRYIVRVELPNADYADYQNLYERMKAHGFDKKIKGSNGVWYYLPDAEYNYEGNLNSDTIFGRAINIAKSVRTKAKVLVTEAVSRRWYNLDKV